MSILVTVPDEIERSARELATASGRTPEETILAALQTYFPPVLPEFA